MAYTIKTIKMVEGNGNEIGLLSGFVPRPGEVVVLPDGALSSDGKKSVEGKWKTVGVHHDLGVSTTFVQVSRM